MKTLHIVALAALAAVCVAAPAQAGVYFDDSFDGASLDPRWSAHVGSAGASITVGGSIVALQSTSVGGLDHHASIAADSAGSNAGPAMFLRMTADINTLTKQWSWVGLSDLVLSTGDMNGSIQVQSRDTDVWANVNYQFAPGQ